MANVYVRSGAGGAATGADWANAYLTLAAALTAKAAGDSFWVSEDHAETQASVMTLTSPGTVGNPCFVYCVNHSGTVPPVSADLRATATIATTGANAMSIQGSAYFYGLTFNCGSGAVISALTIGISPSNSWNVFDNCLLAKLGATANQNAIVFGSANSGSFYFLLTSTPLQFGATGDGVRVLSGFFNWRNTASAIAGTVPTTLFNSVVQSGQLILEGVDLSAAGSGVTLVGDSASGPRRAYLKDCKFGASVTVASTPTGPGASETFVSRSDTGATNYRSEKYTYTGTETTETTIIRTGGASDGTTPQSRKIVATANAKWVLPFQGLPIAIWNDTVGSPVTVTVHAVSGAAGLLNKDDVWMDVEYLGSSATPQGSFATNTKADNLAASVAYTGDGAAWAGSPSGTPFSMSATFTPQQKGTIYIYPKVGKASATVYIDPIAILS